MSTSQSDVVPVNQTSHDEVNQHMEPEDLILKEYITNGTTHRVQTHIGTHTKGRGEEPGNALPEARDGRLRPRGSTKEQQRYGDKYHEEHDILAIAYQTAHRDAKEDARQRVGQHQHQQIIPLGQMWEVKDARHNDCQPRTHNGINHEIDHRLTQDNAERAMIVALDGYEVAEAVGLTSSTCRHANTQHEGLLQDKHQYSRQYGRAIAPTRIV